MPIMKIILQKKYVILPLFLIVALLGTISYIVAIPKEVEEFTEFYILGAEGKTVDYPKKVEAGEEAEVLTGIVNRENEPATYWITVAIDGLIVNEVDPIVLQHEEKWEEMVRFAPREVGNRKKVEFILHKDNDRYPYLELRLWVNVID